MTFDYARVAGTSARLIATYGSTGHIQRTGPGSGPIYNPGPGTVTNHPARMVNTVWSKQDIDGQRVLATDRKVLVDPTIAVEPTVSDLLITPDGNTLQIVNVVLVKPADVAVLYVIQARA